MTCNSNENDNPPEASGVPFPAFHHCKAMTRLTGKVLRYLYLQRFRNFLNLHLELDLDLEFILKIFLAINISDLFDCYCIILALPTLVSVVPLQVDTVFPFPRL